MNELFIYNITSSRLVVKILKRSRSNRSCREREKSKVK